MIKDKSHVEDEHIASRSNLGKITVCQISNFFARRSVEVDNKTNTSCHIKSRGL